ncbi:hypothetical protein FOXB_03400 [Fusarium oxysporum f. sp. conglutinans Fo5176]|uniref:HAT C-terminal dimerisation domain-containing protein n=1 Tax=Fusarium oxysporum (strain Fo5176) TaxID=660025 RepID=F9FAH4_FUSOF|nr:hypothetical protein FOXB_03400 [Fusarium oxysporum f. sp. conglutinans Fo5176]
MLFFGFHQQNVEFAALPIASWLSASNVDTLPTPPSSVFSRLSQPKTVAKQLEEAAVAALPPNPTIEDLPKITWKNRRFVQEDSLARKGAKGRKSWIRSHGTFLVELNYQDQPIGHVWCCNRCDMKGAAEFFSVQATSSAADHLRKHSSPDHPSQPVSEPSPGDESAIDIYSGATPKRRRLERSVIPKAKIKAIQELSVGFVIDSDVPFTIFEYSFLRKIFNHFDNDLVLQMSWSGSSVTREIHRLFEAKRDTIKAELRNALTAVHISFDLWTSPNCFAIMAVFAHFIDQLGHQQSRLRALRRQSGAHSGENLAGSLDLGHWRTKGPIGKLRNIVKFIRSLPQRSEQFKRIAREQNYEGYRLCEESTAELEVVMNNETRWNSTYMMIERALRKQTDIRAFLFAIQEKENEARRIPADDMLSSEDWRVLGAVNEILKPIYLQTMRTQGWGKGDSCGRLWEVLIGMEYLLEHFEDWKVFYSEVTEETMGETQVDAAERIATASANFRESNGRPSRVRRLPARFDEDEVYALLQRSQPTRFIESALLLHSRAEYSTAEKRSASETSQKSTLPADHRAYIRASINNGWKKLNEYYDKLGESPLFAAAIILHPRFGISWLEATWVSEE